MKGNVQQFLEDVRAHILPRISNVEQAHRVKHAILTWDFRPRDADDALRSLLGMEAAQVYGETSHCRSKEPNIPCRVLVNKQWLEDASPCRIAFTLIHELAHVAVAQGHTRQWSDMCKVLGICEQPYEGDSHPPNLVKMVTALLDGEEYQEDNVYSDKDLLAWIKANYE